MYVHECFQVPGLKLSSEQIAALTNHIQFGGNEVVKAKDGAGSATLSMAVAGAKFVKSVAAALDGASGIVECTFVESDKAPTKFFSSRVELGVSHQHLRRVCLVCSCVHAVVADVDGRCEEDSRDRRAVRV